MPPTPTPVPQVRLEQRCVSARLWDEKSWFPSPFQSSSSTSLDVRADWGLPHRTPLWPGLGSGPVLSSKSVRGSWEP